MVKRTRSKKIHVWVCPKLLEQVNQLAYRLGLSRDGAVEKAFKLLVNGNEETQCQTPTQ